ncbi:MAG: hypothetical protein IKU51_07055 [Clostridia bacterium]|nr:hypothetical protein [Clostridia bacterium]
MGLLNKILGEAMVYAESFGVTEKYTYEQALEVLLNPKANPIELAKAENTIVMADKTTGSKAKRSLGVALCKTHGLLTDATTRQAQMYEAADHLSVSCIDAAAEDDDTFMELLIQVMDSDYVKSICLAERALEFVLREKEWDRTDSLLVACANMYGWGCPVNLDLAREFLEKDALPGLKEVCHKGVYRLLARLDEMQ